MYPAEARETGVFKSWNGAANFDLRWMFQLGLESDDVIERAERIILAKLHDGIGFCGAVRMRIGQTEWFHGSVPQSLAAPLRHHFDRQAAIKIRCVLKFRRERVGLGFVSLDESFHKGRILILG